MFSICAAFFLFFSIRRERSNRQKASQRAKTPNATGFCIEVEPNDAPKAAIKTDNTNHTVTLDYFKKQFTVFSSPDKKGAYEIMGKLPDGTSVSGTLLPGSVASAQTLGWKKQTGNFLLTPDNEWKKAVEPKEKFLFTVKNQATANVLRNRAKRPTNNSKPIGHAARQSS